MADIGFIFHSEHVYIPDPIRPPGRRDNMTAFALLLQQAAEHNREVAVAVIGNISRFSDHIRVLTQEIAILQERISALEKQLLAGEDEHE